MDPHGHIHKQLVTDTPFVDPTFGEPGCGREAMVQIDSEAQAFFSRKSDHFLGGSDLIGNRFLT